MILKNQLLVVQTQFYKINTQSPLTEYKRLIESKSEGIVFVVQPPDATQPSGIYMNRIKNDPDTRWSRLIQLGIENLGECVDLQERMIERMKNKSHALDYVEYRTANSFAEILENGELFGIFDSNNKLSAIISISNCSRENFEEHIILNKGFSICDRFKELLLKYKIAYFYCWMSDLDPKNTGLGRHLIKSAQEYADRVLGYDFCMGAIHMENPAAYKNYTKHYYSFGLAHKMMQVKHINKESHGIPVSHIFAVFNCTLLEKIKTMAEPNKEFRYDLSAIESIKSMNNYGDPILKGDEIIVYESNKIFKAKLN